MPRGVGVRVPLSARMFEASDFSSRSSFFCLGQMQALAQQQKNAWSATSRLNMCNKECSLWGCEDRNIFDFQRYPRFTCASLGGRVPLSALQKELFTRQLFFCAHTPQPYWHSLQTSLWEREAINWASDFSSRSSFFLCGCSCKDPYSQFWRLYLLFPKFMLPLWWNQNWPLVEGCFEP